MNPVVKISLVFVLGFSAGAWSLYAFNDWQQAAVLEEKTSPPINDMAQIEKSFRDLYDSSFDDDFFSTHSDPFEKMREMRKNMDQIFNRQFKTFDTDPMFDRWFDGRFGGSIFDVTQSEDEDSILYTVRLKDIDKSSLDIQVENNQVTIRGTAQSRFENSEGETQGSGQVSQQVSRSFPVPPGVDSEKVKMDYQSDSVVIRFPKIKKTI